jgi:outer membrane protein assembly factor BamD (BamD/ComL family)
MEINQMTKKLLWSAFLLVVAVAGCSKKMSEEQLFAEAQKFEAKEDVDGALKIYEELNDRFPASAHADSVLQKLGMFYLNKKGQFEKAIAAYERIVDKFPQSKYQPQALFMIGYIYANHLKNFEQAKIYYDKFIEKYPEHELTASVQWELQHLGKDISEVNIFDNTANNEDKTDGAAQKTAKSSVAK